MEIILNAQPFVLEADSNCSQLIKKLRLGPTRLAIEINGKIIPKSKHGTTFLKLGDRVEIVKAVGGG